MPIIISSTAAFPALSPRPLTVHSTCVAPLSIAAKEFATAKPRSLWQCTLISALSILGTFERIFLIRVLNSIGVEYPTVSGILTTVAPALITASTTLYKNSGLVRLASSAENSTSLQ